MPDKPFMAFTAICAFLNIAPLCWQIEHGNSGPICLGVWIVAWNLIDFVGHIARF